MEKSVQDSGGKHLIPGKDTGQGNAVGAEAYKMGDIPKADLVDLINLFIGWGLSVQKKWLDQMGYK